MTDPTDWKRELERHAAQLSGYLGKVRLSHQSKARLERLTMVAYFLLHKLMEDHRIDDHLSHHAIRVRLWPAESRAHYLAEYQRVLDALSQGPPTEESLSLSTLTNKVIHSYLMLPVIDRSQGLQELVIASDFEHYDRLIRVNLEDLITPLRRLV